MRSLAFRKRLKLTIMRKELYSFVLINTKKLLTVTQKRGITTQGLYPQKLTQKAVCER